MPGRPRLEIDKWGADWRGAMGHDTTGGGSIRFSMAPERHADAPRWGPSKIMTYKEAYDRMILDLLDDMSRRIDRALRI